MVCCSCASDEVCAPTFSGTIDKRIALKPTSLRTSRCTIVFIGFNLAWAVYTTSRARKWVKMPPPYATPRFRGERRCWYRETETYSAGSPIYQRGLVNIFESKAQCSNAASLSDLPWVRRWISCCQLNFRYRLKGGDPMNLAPASR